MRWVVNATPWQVYPREIDPISILREAGLVPGQVWKGEKYLASTGIRSPNRPARSESLYRLTYFWSTYEQRSVSTTTYCYITTKQTTGVAQIEPVLTPNHTPNQILDYWLEGAQFG
jgi:hypothetical protein